MIVSGASIKLLDWDGAGDEATLFSTELFAVARRVLEVILMGKRTKFAVMKQESDMEAEQIRLNQIAASERLRAKLGTDISNAVAEESTSSALMAALQAWRVYVAFTHDLSAATGRRVYEVRWALYERMPNDFLKRRLQAARGSALPPVAIPAIGRQILEAIEAQEPKPGPKITEGEVEYQRMLESKGLVEDDPPDGYVSRTLRPTLPSVD
jgi:hypothetical protein